MLYRADAVIKFAIKAIDGSLGYIKDLYFDDLSWTVRYLVMDVGDWLHDRKVLISPEALTDIDVDAAAFTTNLTREQIQNSPPADSETTVSRFYEERLREYYGWSPYWATLQTVNPWPSLYSYPPFPAGVPCNPEFETGVNSHTPEEEARVREELQKAKEIHLRSFKEIKGYGLRASDGDIGELVDVLIDEANWRITHLVVDTRKWWPGGLVVIDRGLVQEVSWEDHRIVVAMTRDEIRHAPAYDRDKRLTEAWLKEVSDYYRKIVERRIGRSSRPAAPSPGPQPSL